ncbi:MAG: hypothetical protein R3C14_31570 [Caldilineaceae bacterium]
MATYDPNQVLADYAAGRITPEMAVGHTLQHIVQLHAAQTMLDRRVYTLEGAVARMTAWMDKVRQARKPHPTSTPQSGQP